MKNNYILARLEELRRRYVTIEKAPTKCRLAFSIIPRLLALHQIWRRLYIKSSLFMQRCLFYLMLVLSCSQANAESEVQFKSYFVATKSKEVNFRAGPNVRYPLVFKLARKFEPLRVINKFEHWRQVEDSDGDKGWIHVSNLTAKKMAKTKCSGQINLYQKPELNAKVVAHIANDVLFQVISCSAQWCKLERDEAEGWLEKKYLWGAIDDE